MSAATNAEVFRTVIEEGFNRGNYDALDALYAPDYKEHQFGLHTTLEGFKKNIQGLRAGFPDFQLTIEEMVADGDKLWVRMTARGTNTGPFLAPPTGKTVEIPVFDICRFEDGKIVEHWGVPDRFALMAQLGLLPRPEGQPA